MLVMRHSVPFFSNEVVLQFGPLKNCQTSCQLHNNAVEVAVCEWLCL